MTPLSFPCLMLATDCGECPAGLALTAVKRDVDEPEVLADFPNPFNPET